MILDKWQQRQAAAELAEEGPVAELAEEGPVAELAEEGPVDKEKPVDP